MNGVYDEAKFTELLLYVAERLQPDRVGGATKLTGAEYQKLPHGPAPRRPKPVRDALLGTGEAELAREEFLGYELHRLVPLRPADTSVFSEAELETIDQVLSDLNGLNARQVAERFGLLPA